MKSGLKQIKRHTTDRSFHRTFGGVAPIILPQEFSVDAGLTMPNQSADGLYEACTAYSSQDLITDQDGILSDHYREHYEKTLALENQSFGQPCDIRDSLKIAITSYNRGAYYAVESSKFDWFDSIRSVIYTNFTINKIKCAVSVGTPWFKEFEAVSSNGLVPTIFTGDPDKVSWHNWAIKGWKIIDNVIYLEAKTWQGKNFGNLGWSYYPRETINAVMKIRGTGAFTCAPRDAQNIQTVKLTFIEAILDYFQQIISLLNQKKQMNTIPTVEKQPETIVKENMIQKWANLIAQFEGADSSLNNPGNFKFSSLMATWGGQKARAGSDGGYFCKFVDYKTGFQALCNFLTLGAQNQLLDYHNARTIKEFTLVYTNHPIPKYDYSDNLIKALGVTADTQISSFLP